MTIHEDESELRARLEDLQAQHRALDTEISGDDNGPIRDQIKLTRLKRRKLALKDEIHRLLDQMRPDIIA